MGKLTISRLALAITISGFLIVPPTPAFAAPKWLQEMLTVDPPRSQKPRKQRRAKSAQSATSNSIRLPATAPVPDAAPRDGAAAAASQETVAPETPEVAAPAVSPEPVAPEAPAPVAEDKPVEDNPQKDLPQETPPPDAPYVEPFDNSPTEPPIPEFRPDAPAQGADPAESEAAEPEAAKPQPGQPEPAESESAESNAPDLPTEPPPLPEFRPDKPAPGEDDIDVEKAEPEEPPPPADPRSAVRADPSGKLPEEEVACRRRLTELGVEFEERKEETDPSGCSIPYPIVIKNLGSGIGLEPRAEMNCAMAEAAARFAKGPMSSAAKDVFDTTLKSVTHASAYVCRPRNGTRKLSEHAFGNALDIGSFTLSDGTVVAVEPAPPEKNARYLADVRKAACGPFKTVLGPGSDADHAEHFHFDLAPRRNGGTFCQ